MQLNALAATMDYEFLRKLPIALDLGLLQYSDCLPGCWLATTGDG